MRSERVGLTSEVTVGWKIHGKEETPVSRDKGAAQTENTLECSKKDRRKLKSWKNRRAMGASKSWSIRFEEGKPSSNIGQEQNLSNVRKCSAIKPLKSLVRGQEHGLG